MAHPLVDLHRARRSISNLALFLAAIHSAGADKVRGAVGAETAPPVAQEIAQQRRAADPAKRLVVEAIESCVRVREAVHDPALDATIKELTGAKNALELLEQCWDAEEDAHEDLKALRGVLQREAAHLHALEDDARAAKKVLAGVDAIEERVLAQQGFDAALSLRTWDAWSEKGLLRVVVDVTRGKVWPVPHEPKNLQHKAFIASIVGVPEAQLTDEQVAPFVPAAVELQRTGDGFVAEAMIGTPSMLSFNYDYRATAAASRALQRFVEHGDLHAKYHLKYDMFARSHS